MEEEVPRITLTCPEHKKTVILVNPDPSSASTKMFLCAKCVLEQKNKIPKNQELYEFDEFMTKMQGGEKVITQYEDLDEPGVTMPENLFGELQEYEQNMARQKEVFREGMQGLLQYSQDKVRQVMDRFDQYFDQHSRLFNQDLARLENQRQADRLADCSLLNFKGIHDTLQDMPDDQQKMDFLESNIHRREKFRQAGDDVRTLGVRNEMNSMSRIMDQLQNKPTLGDFDRYAQNIVESIDRHFDRVFQQDLIKNRPKEHQGVVVLNVYRLDDFLLLQNQMLTNETLLNLYFDIQPDNLRRVTEQCSRLTALKHLTIDMHYIKLSQAKDIDAFRHSLTQNHQLIDCTMIQMGEGTPADNIKYSVSVIPFQPSLTSLTLRIVNQSFGSDSSSEQLLRQLADRLSHHHQIQKLTLDFSLNILSEKTLVGLATKLKTLPLPKLKINLQINSQLKPQDKHSDRVVSLFLRELEDKQFTKFYLNLNGKNTAEGTLKGMKRLVGRQQNLQHLSIDMAHNQTLEWDQLAKLLWKVVIKNTIKTLRLNLSQTNLNGEQVQQMAHILTNMKGLHKVKLNLRGIKVSQEIVKGAVQHLQKNKQRLDFQSFRVTV